jgi:hypothetical protein
MESVKEKAKGVLRRAVKSKPPDDGPTFSYVPRWVKAQGDGPRPTYHWSVTERQQQGGWVTRGRSGSWWDRSRY